MGTGDHSAICVQIALADAGAAISNGDGIAIAAQHQSGVLGVFAVVDLRGLGREKDGVSAKLGHAGFKGIAGASAFLKEEHVEGLGAQNVILRDAHGEIALQFERRFQHRPEFVNGPVLGGDEVFFEKLGVHGWSLWGYGVYRIAYCVLRVALS